MTRDEWRDKAADFHDTISFLEFWKKENTEQLLAELEKDLEQISDTGPFEKGYMNTIKNEFNAFKEAFAVGVQSGQIK